MKKVTQKQIKKNSTILIFDDVFVVIKIRDIYIKKDIDGKNRTFFDCNFYEKNQHHSNRYNYSLSGQKMKNLIDSINQAEKFKIKHKK